MGMVPDRISTTLVSVRVFKGSTSTIHCSQCQRLVDVKEELLRSGTTPRGVYPLSTWCRRTWL